MIELTGLNGDKILVQPTSLIKIRPPYDYEDPAVTVVEYSSGYLRTLEPITDLLRRLPVPPKMIQVTVPNGSHRFINSGAISQIKAASPENGAGTELVVGGRYQHVMESVAELMDLIN